MFNEVCLCFNPLQVVVVMLQEVLQVVLQVVLQEVPILHPADS